MELEKSTAPDQPGKPRRGKGQRNEICEFYNVCLDLAAKKDWKTFNCEICAYYCDENKVVKEKTENTRICETETCERVTISPTTPFCAACLARKSNIAKAKKKDPVKSDSKTNGKGRTTQKKSILGQISEPIQIDFGKHTSILDEIRSLAEEEMRPLEWQIIYMLKKSLKGINGNKLPIR